jgi:hypothetical protein
MTARTAAEPDVPLHEILRIFLCSPLYARGVGVHRRQPQGGAPRAGRRQSGSDRGGDPAPRLAGVGRRPIDETVVELRALAGRGDLLAETAAVMAGAWTVRIGTGDDLLAAGMLVLAGADDDLFARWVDVGRALSRREHVAEMVCRPDG